MYDDTITFFIFQFSDMESFEEMTENSIVEKIVLTCGNIMTEIEHDVIEMYSNK